MTQNETTNVNESTSSKSTTSCPTCREVMATKTFTNNHRHICPTKDKAEPTEKIRYIIR